MLKTHMPFMVNDKNGNEMFFLCKCDDDGVWKLHYFDHGHALRLDTGLSDDLTECSPTGWEDESGWHISFIAGGGKVNKDQSKKWGKSQKGFSRFKLYRMDGPSISTLSPAVPIQPTATGFIYHNRMVWGEQKDIIHVQEPNSNYELTIPGTQLYRISYAADNPELLLISGKWLDNDEIFSIEYDLVNKTQQLVFYDGQAAYKQAKNGDHVVYARRGDTGFEDRRLKRPRSIEYKATTAVQIVPAAPREKGCGCNKSHNTKTNKQTRPSCLECVEKHLGAAYVLLTECREGYSYRLRAVGHLFEAEDESQEWSHLHNMIRNTRTEYQRNETIPNWDELTNQLEVIASNK